MGWDNFKMHFYYNKVRIVTQNSEQITIEVLTGKSYIFTIDYKRDNEDDITQEIEIVSF